LQHYGSERKDVYRRLFGVLWFGNHVGDKGDGKTPTYVFPIEVRAEVRERFPDPAAGAKDEQYELKPDVYKVSYEELKKIKRPPVPKGCSQCQKKKGSPY
jgi:hypothetical protein